MHTVHQRLTEIKGTDDTEVYFGGLNISDFYQLPPVRDRFVFQSGRDDMCQHLHIYGGIYSQW